MTPEKLIKANDLTNAINRIEILLNETKNSRVTWIEFNFGNGGNNRLVCEDRGEIEIIKSVLTAFHEKKLSLLKTEFENL